VAAPLSKPVHLIGVPLDLGSGRRGVDMGPSAIRIAGLGERLTTLSCEVVDRGDVDAPIPETRDPRNPSRKFIDEIADVCRRLYGEVLEVHHDRALPIVLGGDHSLAAGSVGASADFAAEQGETIGLIWVDAHGDMNTPATTTSGNVHGMPLAALLGAEPGELATIGRGAPKVRPETTVLLGVRNLDALEKDRIRDSRVHVFTMRDIDREGIAVIMARALELTGATTMGIHVSFDLDVCDPSIAPGVGTPVKGGLNYREAHFLMEAVADSGRLMALDLVEVNPILDAQNQTATLATELALSAMGMRII
jgi:arginase